MPRFGAVFALGVMTAAMPAVATPPATSSSTMARASEGSHDEILKTATDEKVICRRDKATGSRVNAKRVCMTARDWAKKTAEERQYIEQRQQQIVREGN